MSPSFLGRSVTDLLIEAPCVGQFGFVHAKEPLTAENVTPFTHTHIHTHTHTHTYTHTHTHTRHTHIHTHTSHTHTHIHTYTHTHKHRLDLQTTTSCMFNTAIPTSTSHSETLHNSLELVVLYRYTQVYR